MLNYRLQRIPYSIKLGMSLILMIVLFGMALVFGAADTSVKDVLSALLSTAPNDQAIMLREIRFPREVAAALIGAALAVSGAIIQGMTRNPLADPGLLGLTAGANAALAITLAFWPSVNYFGVMLACFVGAAVGAILVFRFQFISSRRLHNSYESCLQEQPFQLFSMPLLKASVSILKYLSKFPCGLLEA